MKKIFFLLLLICFSFSTYAQKNDTIYKTDGTIIIEDIGHFLVKKNHFKYSIKRFKKGSEIPLNEVLKIVIVKSFEKRDGSKGTFSTTYKLLSKSKNGKFPKFTEVLVEGYCDLFIVHSTNARDRPIVHYYLNRPQESAGTIIKRDLLLHKSRNSTLVDYFSDCPQVISYINSLEKISREELSQIVKKYNTECSQKI